MVMGQKVNPNGLRIGINRAHSSHWFADKKKFATYVMKILKLENILMKILKLENI